VDDNSVAVTHAAAVIVADEAATAALENAIRTVLLPVTEDTLALITDQIAALDNRITNLEQAT
jgi:hypothetical protein